MSLVQICVYKSNVYTHLHSKQAWFVKPRSDYSPENYLMPYNIKILQPPSLLDLPQNFLSLSIFPSRFLKIRSVVSLRNPGDKPSNRTCGRTRPSWRKAQSRWYEALFSLARWRAWHLGHSWLDWLKKALGSENHHEKARWLTLAVTLSHLKVFHGCSVN